MRVTLAGLLAAVSPIEPVHLAEGGQPQVEPKSQSQPYRLPFSRKVDFDKLQSIGVRCSINGGPATSFQVDTGSVGVIVSQDEVPGFDPKAPGNLPGSITYSSSGIELIGVWTTATLTFPEALDSAGKPATAEIPILAVSERKVHAGAVNAPSTRATTGSARPRPHMFGIGFGRGKEAHPERNPFINLREMKAGALRRGYAITRAGFTLGLNDDVTAGYTFETLTSRETSAPAKAFDPALKDFLGVGATVTVGDRTLAPGTALFDTGLTNMMIGDPANQDRDDLPNGTAITVRLMDGKLTYTFNVGDTTNPSAPRRVTWVTATSRPYVNTGLRALATFDYLYDADIGRLGLRPTR